VLAIVSPGAFLWNGSMPEPDACINPETAPEIKPMMR
jgi:hypothetical protein